MRKISDLSPIQYLGYFPLQSILEKMHIKKYVDYFKLTNDFDYDLYELLSSLIFARAVYPCSKYKTFHEILPNLYAPAHFSYDQLLDGLSFLGNDYEKFVEIFTVQTNHVFGLDTSKTYFDCTNFYFEKPVPRDVIDQLKTRNHVTGKTIHVADKGLSCAQNIAFSKKSKDGYLFSKSVKGLPETEKTWVLLDNGFTDVKDQEGRLRYRYKSCIDELPYKVEHEGKECIVKLQEKRLLTYNPSLASKKRYEINRMVEKAKALAASQAKKAEYGETGKYISFTDTAGGKASVSINQEAIDRELKLP